MMKKVINKKLAQKGGMMIEALAMLGLIAVVTPTMYKKSAERTLEVEDINTATNMRSVMNAADAYVSSNYANLIHSMSEEGNTEKTVSMDSLRQYLPYGFDANKLYDYNPPKVSIVRNGDNLTSFVLFPAKESGEDGLGQERTVRIATLIGANGGYVNDTKKAKGIGGVWSLDQTNFEKVFSGENPNVYSIVTASSDAINNTNSVIDSDKFLYRTDADGKWHTTMRADLFMGGFNPEAADGYNSDKNFSIRNVKRLIIGADSVNGSDPSDQEAIDNSESESQYGLYINDKYHSDGASKIDSAFIRGSLEAAEQFVVDKGHLNYITNIDDELELDVNANYFTLYSKYGSGPDLNDYHDGKVAHQIDARGSIYNYGENVHLAQAWDSESGDFILGTAAHPAIYAEGDGDKGYRRVSLIGDDDKIFQATSYPNAEHSENDKIVMMGKAVKGTQQGDSAEWNEEVKYNTSPAFPVRVGSNAKVEGILSAAQVDAQKLRLATLEAGSKNIDDKYKWLKVDEHGIHGSHLKNDDDDTGGVFSKASVFDVHDTFLALAVGDESLQNGLTFSGDNNGNRNIFFMSSGLGGNAADNYPGINMASTKEINIFVEKEGKDAKPAINLKTNVIQEQLKDNEIVISSLQDMNSTTSSTSVKVQRTNFQVETEAVPVFSVRGNPSRDLGLDFYTRNNSTGSHKADVAVHGDALFTSNMQDNSNGRVSYKYMYIGDTLENGRGAIVNIGSKSNLGIEKYSKGASGEINTNANFVTIGKTDDHAAVNIAGADDYIDNVMYIDVSPSGSTPIRDTAPDNSVQWSIDGGGYSPGVVYVRKGGVEIMPDKAPGDAPSEYNRDVLYSMGTFAANRFVANNLDSSGERIKVPEIYTGTDYTDYNGTSSVRYDTYMVNPAYTSVMHDIKLTTRGGARLSDILPDFINKGIYITSNTYKDKITKLHFAMGAGGITLASGSGTIDNSSGSINLGSADSWASPYLGFVPAPQCPPGYNRLITLAPQSFMMSQAGQMQKGTHARGGPAYYTKNQVPEAGVFENWIDNATQQSFEEVVVKEDASVDTSDLEVDGKKVTGTATAETSDKGLQVAKNLGEEEFKTKTPFFLVTYSDTTPPLTIQQSTWLKTNVIAVGAGDTDAFIGNKPSLGKGWAALMGFVYDTATYLPVLNNLGANLKIVDGKVEGDIGNNLLYDGSEKSVFWNVFPVRRNTLEAYATTYCYFDRNGIMWKDLKDGAHGDVIDHYNALTDYKDYGKEKHSSDAYKKRLNDPALKYDEVW